MSWMVEATGATVSMHGSTISCYLSNPLPRGWGLCFHFFAVEGWTSHPSAVDLFVFNFLTLFRCSLWRFIPNGNVSLLLAARHCARCSHRQGPGQVRIDFIRKTLRRVDRWKALGKFKNVSIRASIYLAFRLIAGYVFLLASFKVRSSMNTSLCRGIRFQFTLPTL